MYFIIIFKKDDDEFEPVKTEQFDNEHSLWRKIQELTNQNQHFQVFKANMVLDSCKN